MSLLEVKSITKRIGERTILSDISFRQRRHERIVIAGETGSGKSSLLQCIAGLLQPDEGGTVFRRKEVEGPDLQLVPGHTGIAYLSQQFELPKFLRVQQVLEYANVLRGAEAEKLYEICKVDHLLERKTDQLSGGERQRIAIARLLSTSPDLLLLDEPYSHLDSQNKQLMKSVVWDICRKLNTTCIIVSHDPLDVLSWAERIIILQKGRIIQDGDSRTIYGSPVNPYVARMFGAVTCVYPGEPVHQKLFGNRRKTQTAIIRPEQCHVVAKQEAHFTGRIKDIHYYGAYMDLEVIYEDKTFEVRTSVKKRVIGGIVSVRIDVSSVRFTAYQ